MRRDVLVCTLVLAGAVLLAGVLPGAAAPERATETVRVLVTFADPPRTADIRALEALGGRVRHRYAIVPAVAAALPRTVLSALEVNARIRNVERDHPVVGLDYRPMHDWGVAHMRADLVHGDGNTGTGARVAVIDSGVSCEHLELDGGNCLHGENYVDEGVPPDDDNGHGTHVAGTIAAERNVGVSTGVVGGAPAAAVIAYKVLDGDLYGSVSDVIAALDHVWNKGNKRADVVNMSLGYRTGSTTLEQAVDRVYASGIVLVAAAGNRGRCNGKGDNVSYPARYESVIAVAAIDKDNKRACWSSTGPDVELSAAGVSVFSAWPEDISTSARDPQPVCETDPDGNGDGNVACHYKYGSGTSMSSPHAAAAAALVIASGVTDANGANGVADEVRGRLSATAVDLGATGRDSQYGYGLIDAYAAAG